MNKPYVKLLGRIKKFHIWSVDGDYVRSNIETDFSLAGHQLAYPKMIPHLEIWIEQTTDSKEEVIFLAIHEIFENKIMAWGLEYEVAHDMATAIEHSARKHPDKVKEILSCI